MRTVRRIAAALDLDVTVAERVGAAFLILGLVVSMLGLLAIGGVR